MIKLKEAIVVEGKYDKIKLESIVDALIITTNGFSIFKDKEKMQMLRCIAEKNGLIVLTDSDSAGFLIRNHLTGCIPSSQIKHIYIPDVFGKEKRKESPSKEGKIGVEGIDVEILKAAFDNAGVTSGYTEKNGDIITKSDFYEDGYTGCEYSSQLRNSLKKRFDLPERLTTNALIDVLNVITTKEEYRKVTDEIKNTEKM